MRAFMACLALACATASGCTWDWSRIEQQIADSEDAAAGDPRTNTDGGVDAGDGSHDAGDDGGDALRDAALDASDAESPHDAELDASEGDADAAEPPADPVLLELSPALSFVNAGATFARTYPEQLSVVLDAPAPQGGVFVAVGSSDDSSLRAVGGGVTVLEGDTQAALELDALRQAASVTLTATLGDTQRTAEVRVVGSTEAPRLVGLEMAAEAAAPGSLVAFDVVLDFPSPAPGTAVQLGVVPPSAGEVPSSVTVPSGALRARALFRDGAQAPTVSLEATLRDDVRSIDLPLTRSRLVISEIDVGQAGTDTADFVELLNVGAASVALSEHQLIFATASSGGSLYRTIDLESLGELAPLQRAVVGPAAVTGSAPEGVLTVVTAEADLVRSSGAIALIDVAREAMLDSIAYGAAPQLQVEPIGFVAFAEAEGLVSALGADTLAWMSTTMCRFPDGADTNVNVDDFRTCTSPTPGAANVYAPALSIDELEYGLGAGDPCHFVEIGNHSNLNVSLEPFTLYVFDGSGDLVRTVPLASAGSLVSGIYWVVVGCTALSSALPSTATAIDLGPTTYWLDGTGGLALVDTEQARVVDALSYGVSLSVQVPGVGTVNLVEGTATTAADTGGIASHTLCRDPAVGDTNDAASDWAVCEPATPGSNNYALP